MIQANELRIGNYLLFFNKLEPHSYVRVTGRFLSQADANGEGLSISQFYSGIPLTPEILEKAGFDEEVELWSRRMVDLCRVGYMNKEGKVVQGPFAVKYSRSGKVLTYVHELQNFWYWFTGEELNIEL